MQINWTSWPGARFRTARQDLFICALLRSPCWPTTTNAALKITQKIYNSIISKAHSSSNSNFNSSGNTNTIASTSGADRSSHLHAVQTFARGSFISIRTVSTAFEQLGSANAPERWPSTIRHELVANATPLQQQQEWLRIRSHEMQPQRQPTTCERCGQADHGCGQN